MFTRPSSSIEMHTCISDKWVSFIKIIILKVKYNESIYWSSIRGFISHCYFVVYNEYSDEKFDSDSNNNWDHLNITVAIDLAAVLWLYI